MHPLVSATHRDLLRRPSVRLVVVVSAVLLAVLPQLPTPGASHRDQSRLTIELGTATIAGVTQTMTGLMAVAAAQPSFDRGWSAELAALPSSRGAYFGARLLGVLVAGLAATGAMSLAVLCLWPTLGIPLSDFHGVGLTLGAVAAGAAASGALGLALGRLLPSDGAVLLLLALPWLPGVLHGVHAPDALIAVAAGTFPAPAGPLGARQFGVNQTVEPAVAILRLAGSALQTAGWLLVASVPSFRESAQRMKTP